MTIGSWHTSGSKQSTYSSQGIHDGSRWSSLPNADNVERLGAKEHRASLGKPKSFEESSQTDGNWKESAKKGIATTSALATRAFDDDSDNQPSDDIFSDALSFEHELFNAKEQHLDTTIQGVIPSDAKTDNWNRLYVEQTKHQAISDSTSQGQWLTKSDEAARVEETSEQSSSMPSGHSFTDNGVLAPVDEPPRPTLLRSAADDIATGMQYGGTTSAASTSVAVSEGAASTTATSSAGALEGGGIALFCGIAALIGMGLLVGAMIIAFIFAPATQRPQDEGYFGALYFWIEYETGKTDDSAFDTVTLNDGLGGQAYGVQFDLKQGSLFSFLRWGLSEQPEVFSAFSDLVNKSVGELYATSQSSPLPAAWHSTFNTHREVFIEAQKTFVYNTYYMPVEQKLERAGWNISTQPDAVKGSIMSYAHQHGTGSINSTTLTKAGITNDDTPAQFITKLYQYRINKFGSYKGLDLKSRYEREVQTALSLLPEASGATSSSAVVNRAREQIGKVTYTWGGCSPGAMDCSGFVSYCLTGQYKRLGTTKTFMTWPRAADPQPGDVCTNNKHCGIYIGNGKMIDCGNSGVKERPVPSDMIIVRYGG